MLCSEGTHSKQGKPQVLANSLPCTAALLSAYEDQLSPYPSPSAPQRIFPYWTPEASHESISRPLFCLTSSSSADPGFHCTPLPPMSCCMQPTPLAAPAPSPTWRSVPWSHRSSSTALGACKDKGEFSEIQRTKEDNHRAPVQLVTR